MARRQRAFTANTGQPRATINTARLLLLPSMVYGRIQHRSTDVMRHAGIAAAARPQIRALLGKRFGRTSGRIFGCSVGGGAETSGCPPAVTPPGGDGDDGPGGEPDGQDGDIVPGVVAGGDPAQPVGAGRH